jgi:hypothetical protein
MRRLRSTPPTGYSGRPLAQKLGIRPGCRLFLHDGPENYAALLAPLPAGAHVVSRLDARTDIVHLFATTRAALTRALPSSLKAVRPETPIWVSWPKKSSGVASDLTENVIREIALPLSLVDIKVCAVDEIWSGLKLVIRRSARPDAKSRPRSASSGPRRPEQ